MLQATLLACRKKPALCPGMMADEHKIFKWVPTMGKAFD
jgi:hypothetical protein